MIQLTNWLEPNQTKNTEYGLISNYEWLVLEEKRLKVDRIVCEIRKSNYTHQGKELDVYALFRESLMVAAKKQRG